MKKLFIKFITFLKKLFSIFLIFNLTCVSTAQAAAVFVDSFSVNAYNEGNLPDAVAFNNNGTKMFVTGSNGQAVNEYTLTTGFDVSTATYAGDDKSFDISNEETDANGLAFNKSGTRMFVTGHTGDDVNEYTLTTAFDVSTASFVDSFSVSSEDENPAAVAFNDDGTKMFVLGRDGDDVNEYTLSCAYKVTSSSTCDDPTTIKDVVGSIEAQIEAAKRFIKQSSGSVLKRLTFIRSHKKDGSLWSVIGNSKDFNVDFANTTLDQMVSLVPELSIHPLQKILPEDWALWSEGSVSFGRIGDTSLSSAQDIRALGITIGADKKIDSSKTSRFFNTVYGIALRLGHDEVDIGTYGSKVDTNAISLSIYGTHYLDKSRFIDGVIGASHLNTDLVRKNSGDTDTNNGERDGKQIYGSIKFGREFEHNEFNVIPTGQINISHTRLEGFTESGTEALRYDDQDINSLMGSLGVMIDRDYISETSILKPRVNFEYSKDVASNSKAHSYYVSDSSKTYAYKANENTQDIFKAGLGFDFTNQLGLTLSGEYEKKIISNVGRINTIFFTASYLSKKEIEYLIALNGDEEYFGLSLKIAKTLGPFALGLQLENDLSSQKNSNLYLSLSSQF